MRCPPFNNNKPFTILLCSTWQTRFLSCRNAAAAHYRHHYSSTKQGNASVDDRTSGNANVCTSTQSCVQHELDQSLNAFHQAVTLVAEENTKLVQEKKKVDRMTNVVMDMQHVFTEHYALPPESVIQLNVGGELITTTRSTLMKYPNTVLGALFSGHYPVTRDKMGRVFLDRDPHIFKEILEWLRTDLIPKRAAAASMFMNNRRAFNAELDYFGLKTAFNKRVYPVNLSPVKFGIFYFLFMSCVLILCSFVHSVIRKCINTYTTRANNTN